MTLASILSKKTASVICILLQTSCPSELSQHMSIISILLSNEISHTKCVKNDQNYTSSADGRVSLDIYWIRNKKQNLVC